MDAEIRSACAGDETGVRALIRGERLNPTGIRWRNFLVAETEGAVVAAVQLRPSGEGVVELGSLVVRADLRRRGLGARMVEAALGAAGRRRVLAITAASLAPWYGRWGFREIGPGAAPWPVRINWLMGQGGSLVALAHLVRPRRLAVLERTEGVAHGVRPPAPSRPAPPSSPGSTSRDRRASPSRPAGYGPRPPTWAHCRPWDGPS